MKVVWKWDLPLITVQDILMPVGARILCLQVQHGHACIWAEVAVDETRRETRRFLTISTGQAEVPAAGVEYIGTYQLDDGAEVFHVYWDQR